MNNMIHKAYKMATKKIILILLLFSSFNTSAQQETCVIKVLLQI